MLMKKKNSGFSTLETILVLVIIGLVGFIGWYVWSANNKSDSLVETSTQNTTKNTSKAELEKYTFPQEKLAIGYNGNYWNIDSKTSGNTTCQNGSIKQDTLSLKHQDFTLSYQFGDCPGKGGGICFEDPGGECVRETKKVATVNAGDSKNLYVLASRTTTDSGKAWNYELLLDDNPTCTSAVCTLIAKNIDDDTASIVGRYENKSDIISIDKFIALPEVSSAISVLKTSTY